MRYAIAIVGLLILIGGLAAIKATQIKTLIAAGAAGQAAGPPPEVVSSAPATEVSWENKISSVGSVTSSQGVTISNEIAGVVSAIRFESGALVKKGQVLVEIDSSVERAQLASSAARRDLAKISAGRSRALVQDNVVAKSELDTNEANLKATTADVSALQAQIDRKTIRAPFDGRLGIRQINLGQYLTPGTAITLLQAVDAIFIDFTLPQTELDRLAVGMPVRIDDAVAGKPVEGAVVAVDPTLDAISRSIKVRASVAKSGEALRPGMFVNVSLLLPQQKKVVIVPSPAVVHASFGDSVFIVEDKKDESGKAVNGPDGKPAKVARQQFVKSGEARGDFVAILDGVKTGQEVVVAGAFKLRNGAGVVINNSVKLDPKLAPRPENR